jgi:deoxyribose-phosphate aldolase
VKKENELSPAAIARYIDHTLLSPDAEKMQIQKLCGEARRFGFAAVCVNPCYIGLIAQLLAGSAVKPCTVVGFPLGALTPQMKAGETHACVALGAKEIDMVANIGAIKSGDWALVQEDIFAVVKAAKESAIVKVIIETCLLTDDEKRKVCITAKEAGAHFVKTSTGFSTGGATVYDVKLMSAAVGADMGVKASGGIKCFSDAAAIIEAGATRIGTSAGIKIVMQ